MARPVRWDLEGDRGQAFTDTATRLGVNWTGASFRSQVRLTPDAPGDPLITPTISLLYGGTDTLANHVSLRGLTTDIYKYTNPSTGQKYAPTDSVAMSKVQASIPAADMVAPGVPAPSPIGDDAKLAWDALVTPSGGSEAKEFYGNFIVHGTVTQP